MLGLERRAARARVAIDWPSVSFVLLGCGLAVCCSAGGQTHGTNPISSASGGGGQGGGGAGGVTLGTGGGGTGINLRGGLMAEGGQAPTGDAPTPICASKCTDFPTAPIL